MSQFDEAGDRGFDVPPLKGPLRVREAQQRLAVLENILRDGETAGTQLCQSFTRQFPQAPAKLVRYNDRSLTFYRWRQSSARQWGGGKTAAINLTGKAGQALLSRLPEKVRQIMLNYERRRIQLNLRLSMAAYERYRIQDWLNALDTIKAIERGDRVDETPANYPGR